MAKRKRAETPIEDIVVDTITPVRTDYTGLDRINSIPDYSAKIKENFLEDIIFKYSLMGEHGLVAASKDKNITILERQVLQQLLTSINKGKSALQAVQMLQDRIAGKARNRNEVSGPNGKPIAFSQEETDAQFDAALDAMSDKELAAYEKAVKVLSKLKAKGVDE